MNEGPDRHGHADQAEHSMHETPTSGEEARHDERMDHAARESHEDHTGHEAMFRTCVEIRHDRAGYLLELSGLLC